MNPDMASRYTDGTYLESNPDWGELDAEWKSRQVLKMMRDHQLAPKSICDIGCGTGGVLAWLAKDLAPTTELIGYEVSEQAIQLAPAERKSRIDFRLRSPAQDAQDRFDLALCLDVFEHVDDYPGFLRGLKSLAPLFIFHIPLGISAQAVIRGAPLLDAWRRVGHIHWFTLDLALEALHDTGYEVIDRRFTVPAENALSDPQRRPGLVRSAAALSRRVAFRLRPEFVARLLGGFPVLVLARPVSRD